MCKLLPPVCESIPSLSGKNIPFHLPIWCDADGFTLKIARLFLVPKGRSLDMDEMPGAVAQCQFLTGTGVGGGRREKRIFWVTRLPSNTPKIPNTPSQPAPGTTGDLVIEMKCQAEWVIDCQLDKLSKHFHSGFPVHTYYPITSGWRGVILRTDHPDRGDNWANWD